MILEPAVGRQGRAVLVGAVVVTREAVAFRPRVRIVQVGGDLWRAETDLILRQVVAKADDDRSAIAREDRRAGGDRARCIAFVTPDALRRIGRMEHPIGTLFGLQLVQ
ncbi:hypothetical protein D3C71_1830340 [compost metagenome]